MSQTWERLELKTWAHRVALGLVFLAAGPSAEAQIVAPAGRTLFNEGVLLRSLLRLDTFEESPAGDELERLGNTYALVWGARPHLTLSLVAPVIRTELRAPGGAVSRSGTGDVSVFARYDVLRRTVPGGYTRLAPELGAKLPTGGAFGSGSTDLIAGLVYSRVRDPDWWIADVQLTLPGSGDGGFRAGERQRFDVAYLRRLRPRGELGVPMLLGVLELNGESSGRSERAGDSLPGTGGEVLYLSPGLEYIANRRVVLEASLPVVIYDGLGGAMPKPEISLIAGVRWLF